MFSEDLQRIRKVLLQGGVAPRFVNRTISELQDHHADISAALVKEGYTAQQAAAEAAFRVGDLEQIARDTLNRKELKSRVSLWPKTTLLLGPVLVFPAVATLIVLFFVGLIALLPEFESEPSLWFMGLTWSLIMFYMYLLPVLLATALIIIARQRAIAPKLIFFSILATAFMGTLIDAGVTFPDGAGEDGSIHAVLHFAGYAPGARAYSMALQLQTITRMVITTLLALSIWRLLRMADRKPTMSETSDETPTN